MKFDRPAGTNAIDQLKVIGRPTDRIDGPIKTTGRARYAYEYYDAVPNQAVGAIVAATIPKGRVVDIDTSAAVKSPGVLAIVSTLDHKQMPPAHMSGVHLFGGDEIAHYHQAIAVVVAETFEQARDAAASVRVSYERSAGNFDLAEQEHTAPLKADESGDDPNPPLVERVGDFDRAFAEAPVKLDQLYVTPSQSHAMMEPHATLAAWEGERLTVWTSNQMINWCKEDLAKALAIPQQNIRILSPFIGGGFGSKLFVRADVVLAALASRAAGRPVKIGLPRPLIFNNTTHRAETRQRIRLAATRDGRLTAIGHSSFSGNLPNANPEVAISPTRGLYAAPNRELFMRLAKLDLPEGNSMRAPGEASGLMALEMAMDEMAERLGLDPVEFRILNDTAVDPAKPNRPFSERHLAECLLTGANRFGWDKRRSKSSEVREGHLLIGLGMAAGIRANKLRKSAARVRLETDGRLTVETDMTDIGTGTYTIIAQTAAEMLGLGVGDVTVKLADSDYPVSAGSGGQWGANNSTAGVYAACMRLREMVTERLGLDRDGSVFEQGRVSSGNRSFALSGAAAAGALIAEDDIEYGELHKKYEQATFVAHFAEVAVDSYTGEIHVRRMLAVCDAGRILNPKTARSQVIGAMVMGLGAALTEALAVDKRRGFFVNHDLAGYEVPVHADIPEQEVILLDYPDNKSSPTKAKGVGELGLCGVAAAIANAVYNATGVRVREYPITLDKHIDRLASLD